MKNKNLLSLILLLVLPFQMFAQRDSSQCNLYITGKITNVSEYGGSDGAIDVSTYNVRKYTLYYYWSNGEKTEDLNHIPAGVYSLRLVATGTAIEDSSFYCETTTSFTVTQPDEVAPCNISIKGDVTNVSEYGKSDGAIDITISNIEKEHQINWSSDSIFFLDNIEDLREIPAGRYTVQVSDARCSATKSFTITQPDEIHPCNILIKGDVTNVSEYGKKDGAIDITISNIDKDYQVNWYNNSIIFLKNIEDIQGIPAGEYTVRVNDTKCSATKTFTVTQPEEVVPCNIEITGVVTDASEYGASDGAIDVTIANTTNGYQIFWSNGKHTEDIKELKAGNYTITVVDSLLCKARKTFMVSQPRPANPLIPKDTLDPVQIDTCIEVYSYHVKYVELYANGTLDVTWEIETNDAAKAEIITKYRWYKKDTIAIILTIRCYNLKANTNLYAVLDLTEYEQLGEALTVNNNSENTFKLYPNPVANQLNLSFAEGLNNAHILILDMSGKSVFSQAFATIQNGEIITINTDMLNNGAYMLSIQSNNASYTELFLK